MTTKNETHDYVTREDCLSHGKTVRSSIALLLGVMSLFVVLLIYSTTVSASIGDKYDESAAQITEIREFNARQEEINKNMLVVLDKINGEIRDQKIEVSGILRDILKAHQDLLSQQKQNLQKTS